MPSLKSSDVSRMRLVAQRVMGERCPDAVAAVRHLTCAQGQDFPGSTMSVALRTKGRSLGAVWAAYDSGEMVRSWPMRGTLHVVAAEDLGWMLELTGPAMVRSTARRREQLGLTDADLGRAEELAREALAGGGLVRAELLGVWERAGIAVEGGRGYHLLFHLALRGVICQGPMVGREQAFVLNDAWIRAPRRLGRDEAVAEWLRRYVVGHGPVPVADFLWWTKLLRRDVAPVLAQVRAEVEVVDVDGVEHWMRPGLADEYAGAVRRAASEPVLLPGFDEMMLGYGDRRALLTEEEELLVVPGRNGVFRPIVVHGGRAVGTWKRPARSGAVVEVTPFGGALPAVVERALPRLTASLPV